MSSTTEIEGQAVQIELSPAAEAALRRRSEPLIAEMELYFSCLIRKKVRFYTALGDRQLSKVNEQLSICFRPVMTEKCGKDYEGDEPPLTDFPIQKSSAFVPAWLRIDYQKGEWLGEFGYEH